MSWRHKISGVLLVFTLSLIEYFATGFPLWTHPDPNPEYGPFFQGDILDNPWDRNGIPGQSNRWSKGIFKFFVSDEYNFYEMENIYKAVMEIVTKTCMTEEELLLTGSTRDHVYYRRDEDYCAASVGRRGWRQYVYLGRSCFQHGHGIPLHETLHAIGFYHEHSRTDRDDYVHINIKNVEKAFRKDFDILPSNAYGVGYDYRSIMHYDAYAFAIDRNVKTIEVKQPGAQIGQRSGMSHSDISKVNLMYQYECNSRMGADTFDSYLYKGLR